MKNDKIDMFAGLCYWTYAYMFKFGPFRPNMNIRKPTSLDEVRQDFKREVTQDIDSFTQGTHKLGDWLLSKFSDKKDAINDSVTRTKRMLAKSADTSSNNGSDSKTD